MSELLFWKPMMKATLEHVGLMGHRLGPWQPQPPDILPNWERFVTVANCEGCGMRCGVEWFPGETFRVTGEVLMEDCTQSLRQPAA